MKGEDGCDLIIVGQRVLIAGQFQPAAVFVEKGKIVAIKTPEEVPTTPNGVQVLRLEPHQVLLPGLVDSHVHVNDPGRNHWEDFSHATQSAAWGGVTTIADMPLNSIPPTTTVANFQKKLNATEGKLWIDVCFIGGVVQGNPDDVLPLLETGVKGFKCFLINSGVDEFVHVELEDLEKALAVLSGAKPASPFLMYHAEMELTDEELLQHSKKQGGDPLDYTTFLDSRPQAMENKAIQLVIDMCRKYGVRSHIVHLSSSSALPLIKKAKDEGLPLTVETCYHYLTFSSENIPRGEPRFKCCPPIRETDNNAELWEGLKQGIIDLVVSDHSPCTAELKTKGGGDYLESWGGISSLQFGLAILHTEAVIKRGLPLAKVISWLSESPAKLLGIQDQKGSIAVGHDADLVVFDPNETFEIKQDMILHKNKLTAYEGMKLVGRVKKTILRGKVIFDQESFITDGFPHGKTLLKK